MRKQLDRVTREVGTFKGKVTLWDVINETVIMPVFDRYDNAVTRLCIITEEYPLLNRYLPPQRLPARKRCFS